MKRMLLVGIVVVLGGCGTARTLVLEPVKQPNHFQRVELVEAPATVKVPAQVTEKFRSVVEKGLYENGKFLRGNDLRISYTIISDNPGSQFQRWFWGGIGNAGEGSLVIMVRYLDASDAELAKTEIEGRIGSGFFGGDFEEAITKAGEDLVKFTIDNFASQVAQQPAQ
ncbi:hypothetical protein [Cupriavidus sp. BIS7]|uniref:hypothetical protein n=1 Tax=Cupriavidus sp. BIS7 TaxID=1217718 RepID=UPI00037B1FB4|nr:hypothetical protein [Cupriavidus sp. BIS7]